MIFGHDGKPIDGSQPKADCDHNLSFDEVEAQKLLDGWKPTTDVDFIMGNPASSEIRKRWPRGWFTNEKPCPLGCGFIGIAYASYKHYLMGDW
jgi:hypothetical protein